MGNWFAKGPAPISPTANVPRANSPRANSPRMNAPLIAPSITPVNSRRNSLVIPDELPQQVSQPQMGGKRRKSKKSKSKKSKKTRRR